MRYVGLLAGIGLLLAVTGTAGANSVASSTMWFKGSLSDGGGGVYTGAIPMTEGYYYIVGGPGYGSRNVAYQNPANPEGGFDVYGQQGATAYSQYPGNPMASYTMDADHDAYEAGSPLGHYTPNISDWDYYTLELTQDHWYLWYDYSGSKYTPMSGTLDWSSMTASETDLGTNTGTVPSNDPQDYGGGAGAFDWEIDWGIEVIPLQYGDFAVEVTSLGGGDYEVSLTPVPEPVTMAGLMLGIGCLARYVRRRR